MAIVLSSPHTRTHKFITPPMVLGVSLMAVLWTVRTTVNSHPIEAILLLIAVLGGAGWFVWRPLKLKVADVVTETPDGLEIRRGAVLEVVPYSDIHRIDAVRLGNELGAKLVFARPNKLGSEIGFHPYYPDPSAVPSLDPVEHIQRRIGASHQHRVA